MLTQGRAPGPCRRTDGVRSANLVPQRLELLTDHLTPQIPILRFPGVTYECLKAGLSRYKSWRQRPQVGPPEECPTQCLVARVICQILDAIAGTKAQSLQTLQRLFVVQPFGPVCS
jgi:hypothetical protein